MLDMKWRSLSEWCSLPQQCHAVHEEVPDIGSCADQQVSGAGRGKDGKRQHVAGYDKRQQTDGGYGWHDNMQAAHDKE